MNDVLQTHFTAQVISYWTTPTLIDLTSDIEKSANSECQTRQMNEEDSGQINLLNTVFNLVLIWVC
jgi:hypothetical protein